MSGLRPGEIFDWVTCASCSGHERDGFVVKKTAPFWDSGVKTDEKKRGAANDDWLSVKKRRRADPWLLLYTVETFGSQVGAGELRAAWCPVQGRHSMRPLPSILPNSPVASTTSPSQKNAPFLSSSTMACAPFNALEIKIEL